MKLFTYTLLLISISLTACKSRSASESSLKVVRGNALPADTFYVLIESSSNKETCIGIIVSDNTLIVKKDCISRLEQPQVRSKTLKIVVSNEEQVGSVSSATNSNFVVMVFADGSFNPKIVKRTDSKFAYIELTDGPRITEIKNSDVKTENFYYIVQLPKSHQLTENGSVLVDSFGSFLGDLLTWYPSDDGNNYEAIYVPWSRVSGEQLLIEKAKKQGARFEYFTSDEVKPLTK